MVCPTYLMRETLNTSIPFRYKLRSERASEREREGQRKKITKYILYIQKYILFLFSKIGQFFAHFFPHLNRNEKQITKVEKLKQS